MGKKYSLKPNKNKDIVYTGILLTFVNIFILITNGQDYHSSVFNIISVLIEIIYFPLAIYYIIRSGVVAYKLNKSVILWVLISIFITPISIIVLGNKETNNIPTEFERIFRKYRDKYNTESMKYIKLHNNGKIDSKELAKREQTIISTYEAEMNAEIQQEIKIKTNVKDEIINTNKEVSIKGKSVKYSKCPACGHNLAETDNECPDCGLFIG